MTLLLVLCLVAASLHQGGGIKISTKGHRYISELGDSVDLPCTVSGHGFSPFFHVVTWYKIEDGEQHQINTITSINQPFMDTARYSIKPNQTDDNTVHMTLSITNVSLAENGSYRCDLKNVNSVIGSISHILTVPASLSSFTFTSNNTRDTNNNDLTFEFEEGVPYHVTCSAVGGNPMPTLRVSLGKEDITDQFSLTAQGHRQGITGLQVSHYTVKLVNTNFVATEQQRGENLKCVAKFHRYTELRQAKTAAIEVKYGPRFLCEAIRRAWPDERDFEIDCTLKANPTVDVKSVVWQIGDTGPNATTLTVGQSKLGYTSNATLDRTNGEVRVSLVIANITNVTYQLYHLTARNDLSEQTYNIELVEAFTTVEPTTVETTTEAPKQPTLFQGDVVIAQKDSAKPAVASSSGSTSVIAFITILAASLIALFL